MQTVLVKLNEVSCISQILVGPAQADNLNEQNRAIKLSLSIGNLSVNWTCFLNQVSREIIEQSKARSSSSPWEMMSIGSL